MLVVFVLAMLGMPLVVGFLWVANPEIGKDEDFQERETLELVIATLFYHIFQFSMILSSGVYFWIYASKKRPTIGMRLVALPPGGKTFKHYVFPAVLVSAILLVLVEVIFSLSFGISITGALLFGRMPGYLALDMEHLFHHLT